MELSRQRIIQETNRRVRENKEVEPYFFYMSEINLFGRTLYREDMSLVFYEPEDIEMLSNIFKNISDPCYERIYDMYRVYYLETLYKQYNFNVITPKDRVSSVSLTQQISNKWDNAYTYFRSIKPEDYIKFVNYCTAFLRIDLHTFLFFVPNYLMDNFSDNKDIALYYHWRLALNR